MRIMVTDAAPRAPGSAPAGSAGPSAPADPRSMGRETAAPHYPGAMDDHRDALREAFDGQAARFERSAVLADPAALARLVSFASLPPGSRVLDAGCGPGLVSEAFLAAGHRVEGVDLSPEMVSRARSRCARFGDRALFEERSVFDLAPPPGRPYDAAVSRFVIHHVQDPLAFVRRTAALVRPGGALVLCDQTSDPDPERFRWHQGIERARDRTHTRHLTLGGLVDLLVAAGLGEIRSAEEPFDLDFDEWFDRGTPGAPKPEVRRTLLAGSARGFEPEVSAGGSVRIRTWRALVRGERRR